MDDTNVRFAIILSNDGKTIKHCSSFNALLVS